MAFTFEVRFSGACAFVPRKQKGKVWVLLVNQEKEEEMASF